MTVPEIIAQLDVMENELESYKARLRLLRHDLFETLDETDTGVVG